MNIKENTPDIDINNISIECTHCTVATNSKALIYWFIDLCFSLYQFHLWHLKSSQCFPLLPIVLDWSHFELCTVCLDALVYPRIWSLDSWTVCCLLTTGWGLFLPPVFAWLPELTACFLAVNRLCLSVCLTVCPAIGSAVLFAGLKYTSSLLETFSGGLMLRIWEVRQVRSRWYLLMGCA